jgi:hypothetical protein
MPCQLKENKSQTVHNFLQVKVKLSLFINAMPLIHIDGLEIKLNRFLILAQMSGEVYTSSFCKGDCCAGGNGCITPDIVDFSTSWR